MTSNRTTQREDAHFRILRLLEARPDASQRDMASHLGLSLGAANYCLRALVERGYVKLENFRASTSKLGYVYVLTPDGVAHRARLASRFIARKLAEYDALREELDALGQEYPEVQAARPGETPAGRGEAGA